MKINYTIRKTKFILIVLGLITGSHIKAQSISALDSTKGYYNFKLGDSYQISPKLEKFLDAGSQKSYFYKSPVPLQFFKYPVSNVILTFNNQKLISFTIDLGVWDTPEEGRDTNLNKSLNEFANLINSFKSLYGSPTESESDLDSGKIAFYWEAKSNFLISKLTYLGLKKGSRISLEFGDKKLLLQSIETLINTQ